MIGLIMSVRKLERRETCYRTDKNGILVVQSKRTKVINSQGISTIESEKKQEAHMNFE